MAGKASARKIGVKVIEYVGGRITIMELKDTEEDKCS